MGQSTEDMLNELVTLINKLRWVNEHTNERTRNMSLAITNLENAEDKLRRHFEELK